MPYMRQLLLCLLGLLLIPGCQETAETPAVAPARVFANPAYLEHFGQPPQPRRGIAYARVGYLPLREQPERVRPFPLFLFSDENQLSQVLQRLVGRELLLDPQGPMFHPFPPELTLQVGTPQQGALTLELGNVAAPEGLLPAARALIETACQFPGVERVVILVAGEPLPGQPREGLAAEPTSIVAPGEPHPLMIAGMWEPGEAEPEEILFNFDRPVKVNRFVLNGSDGKPLAGEYFTSVFDMAVVFHPAGPGLVEGSLLEAEWSVTDALGRSASGRSRYPLLRFEH